MDKKKTEKKYAKGSETEKVFFLASRKIMIALEEAAKKNGVNRSVVIRKCIEKALDLDEEFEF